MSYIGIDIGSTSLKMVSLDGAGIQARVVNHRGRPLSVLEEVLEHQGPGAYVGISGPKGHLSEVAAIQRALEFIDSDFDALVSLGGESFVVYLLKGSRIVTVLSHNKCAAGSGEFLVQQVERLGLSLDQAIEMSFSGKAVPLAARCSVHCKSDITHKLNRKEASVEDILYTLHESMAEKVVSLLERNEGLPSRVLVIGGLSKNKAIIDSLRRKLPHSEVHVLPESTYFEALGSALLTRDNPQRGPTEIRVSKTFPTLPALARYGSRVEILEPPTLERHGTGPFALGIDAGSTTTKAVLVDPADGSIAASHYARTHGDPLRAARHCLTALAEKTGDRQISWVATTGSARDIVGSYLCTEHAYNEISAHAAGAAHYAPDVDTIFEIGGQDAKYIYLRNGVPVDYAMNGACSAGTGSFLEECAQSDLGVSVEEIADVALKAEAPVQFKATCAAFINSDIRAALLEGYAREDIIAGLVYSIATNYLAKVKGARRAGDKIFLQGGVACNRAVAHAFAHCVDREIVVPPHPELLGAYGVALLALQRDRAGEQPPRDLCGLGRAEMEPQGRFTCKACGLYCPIDRFEVAGRRITFGGRCSLFEKPGWRNGNGKRAPDLVGQRSRLIFARSEGTHRDQATRIGILRALSSHSLFPLYSTFFAHLGMEVVLSDVEPRGGVKAQSGFCFPVQISHGAVWDLVQRNVALVFLPHLLRMPNPEGSKDSYLCPITQADPYFLAKAFPSVRFLSPVLDFSAGYRSSSALVDMVVSDLGADPDSAKGAYEAAVGAQLQAEEAMHQMGGQALADALRSNEPTVILVGHSYNAFVPEASQSVARKLTSMGIPVIPGDCLGRARGTCSWHFSNSILSAADRVNAHANLFLVYVSNFSCTIDAFTQSMLAARVGSKPYLLLEIDSHTADAGIQTRLEAFVEIIDNYGGGGHQRETTFIPCRLRSDRTVTTSSGESIPFDDPRVKLYVPAFSDYHSESAALALRWLGLRVGDTPALDRRQLDRGLRYTSGRECLPLPICIGQLLEIHEKREPGEIVGFYVPRGGAPCVLDAYKDYVERFIADQAMHDTFIFELDPQGGGFGADLLMLGKHLVSQISLADILVEAEQCLRVVSDSHGIGQLRSLWRRFSASATSPSAFDAQLPRFVAQLGSIPRFQAAADCPKVIVIGDFFTRFSPYFMEQIQAPYTRKGIILKPTDLNDLLLYTVFDKLAATSAFWGLSPDSPLAIAYACSHLFRPDAKAYLATRMWYWQMKRIEHNLRKKFKATGLLVAGANDTAGLFGEAAEHMSRHLTGEAFPTIGKGLTADAQGYDGVVLTGPFNCLPYRISEAILRPLCAQRGMPFLAYETDGYSASPGFLRLVDVHVQQVLHRRKRSAG